MRTQLLLMTGAAALLAGCTESSSYQPAVGYSEAPASYQSYTVTQPAYQVQPSYQVTTYYTQPAPEYPLYSPEGSPPHTNDGGHSK
jgi:hypothetical protein